MQNLKKVLILGASGAGKSFILNRLFNMFDCFKSNSDTQVVSTIISTADTLISTNNGNINLRAFDTPGEYFKILLENEF